MNITDMDRELGVPPLKAKVSMRLSTETRDNTLRSFRHTPGKRPSGWAFETDPTDRHNPIWPYINWKRLFKEHSDWYVDNRDPEMRLQGIICEYQITDPALSPRNHQFTVTLSRRQLQALLDLAYKLDWGFGSGTIRYPLTKGRGIRIYINGHFNWGGFASDLVEAISQDWIVVKDSI